MFDGYRSADELFHDLAGAGCSEEMIVALLHSDRAESLRRLEEFRAELLNEIHREKYCIEFLNEQLCILKKGAG